MAEMRDLGDHDAIDQQVVDTLVFPFPPLYPKDGSYLTQYQMDALMIQDLDGISASNRTQTHLESADGLIV